MTDFWEHNFREKQTIWRFEPADSANAYSTVVNAKN